MPDALGRYFLSELEDRVERELNIAQLTVNTSTRVESTGAVYPSQLLSNTDIDRAVNSSIVGMFLEMSTDHEDLFAQTGYISTAVGIGPYALPFNMLKLRWLKWKSPSLTLQNILPDQWQPMVMFDEDISLGQDDMSSSGTPSYRREGDSIVLNEFQQSVNSNGIQINYVALPPELINPTDVIQTQFVRLLQQFVIFDVAVMLGQTRKLQISEETITNRQRFLDLLMKAVDNAYQPQAMQMYSQRIPKRTYSGRRFG